ncbi:methyltransferase domain-containing protein [Aurantivibrio infirmus]
MSESETALEQWLSGALGTALLAEEHPQIDNALRDLYGFHLMQLSIGAKSDLTSASTINHRFALSPHVGSVGNEQSGNGNSLVRAFADIEKIPLESESIDVALLHHVLEFTENPHQLLRETARVIIPRGYVVIVGFNPYGWFGLFKHVALLATRKIQWRRHSLRLGRLVDWLRLLDFEPVSVTHGYYRWPIDHQGFVSKTSWFEDFFKKIKFPVGGFYLVLARKDVVAMTPIKPSWKKIQSMEGLVGARPSSRVSDPVPSRRTIH